MGDLLTFRKPAASPPQRAQTPRRDTAPRMHPGESAPASRERGTPSHIHNVTSLDQAREGGRRVTDLRAAVARALAENDIDRACFFQGALNAEVRRAQAEARRVLYPLPCDDGPKDAA